MENLGRGSMTDPLTSPTVMLIAAGQRARERMANYLKPLGLSWEQWVILETLQRGRCTVGELATYTDMRISAVSKRLDRLVNDGWVMRDTDPDDQRRVWVSVTDYCRSQLHARDADWRDVEREAARLIGHWETERLVKLLGRYLQRR